MEMNVCWKIKHNNSPYFIDTRHISASFNIKTFKLANFITHRIFVEFPSFILPHDIWHEIPFSIHLDHCTSHPISEPTIYHCIKADIIIYTPNHPTTISTLIPYYHHLGPVYPVPAHNHNVSISSSIHHHACFSQIHIQRCLSQYVTLCTINYGISIIFCNCFLNSWNYIQIFHLFRV